MIEVHERFEVASDPRTVWGVISNPSEVVSCVPGASLGEQHEDGSYDAGLTVKFGPTRVTFRARVTLELDDATMTGRLTAQGKDNQGGTRMKTAMTFQVAPEGSGSSVAGDGQVELSGRLAGMIEGGASIVVKRMSNEFARNLADRCAATYTSRR
jgi:carbon monoxide dehydrogenase subunit G